jgi:hypothetical protein
MTSSGNDIIDNILLNVMHDIMVRVYDSMNVKNES